MSNNNDLNNNVESNGLVTDDQENNLSFNVDWNSIDKKAERATHHRRRHHHQSDNDSKLQSVKVSDKSNKRSRKVSKASKIKDLETLDPKLAKIKNKKPWSKKKKVIISILITFISIIAIVLGTILSLWLYGRYQMLNYDNLRLALPQNIDYEENGRIVHYKGHTYQFNENIASILFMGVDNRKLEKTKVAGNAGQADALFLFTHDTRTSAIKVLSLNRDTMTDIARYDKNGKYYDTSNAQLCLAYAYGDGKELSAENQVTAVERLIYNIPIKAYYAIDLDAIKILNDDIGGVTVTPNYTFGSFKQGVTTTIHGDRAEEFVRTRDVSKLDDNLRRVECQKTYLDSFAKQTVTAVKQRFGVTLDLYNHSKDETITNVNVPILAFVGSSLAINYNGLNTVSVKGKYVTTRDTEFAEYKLNKKDLFEKILEVYYVCID